MADSADDLNPPRNLAEPAQLGLLGFHLAICVQLGVLGVVSRCEALRGLVRRCIRCIRRCMRCMRRYMRCMRCVRRYYAQCRRQMHIQAARVRTAKSPSRPNELAARCVCSNETLCRDLVREGGISANWKCKLPLESLAKAILLRASVARHLIIRVRLTALSGQASPPSLLPRVPDTSSLFGPPPCCHPQRRRTANAHGHRWSLALN